MINRWILCGIIVWVVAGNSLAQMVFDTDRYAYNFEKCISAGKLKKSFLSKKYKPDTAPVEALQVRGDILQIDTVSGIVLIHGVLFYSNQPVDSIEVKLITQVDESCAGAACKYLVYNQVSSVTNVNGLFILTVPEKMRLDGLIFRDLSARFQENNAWFFRACIEGEEPDETTN